jgi:hypothetical protein
VADGHRSWGQVAKRGSTTYPAAIGRQGIEHCLRWGNALEATRCAQVILGKHVIQGKCDEERARCLMLRRSLKLIGYGRVLGGGNGNSVASCAL